LDAGLPNDLAAIWSCTSLNVMLSYIFQNLQICFDVSLSLSLVSLFKHFFLLLVRLELTSSSL
jgi:hypothetical protein